MTFDANPHTETRTARAGRNTLNVYLDDAGAFDLMSAEEERFVARQIAELRRDYWRALLSSPTLVEPVLEAACRVLGKDALANERLERVREALRLFTDGKDAEHAHALAAELEQVAIHLGGLDCDRVAAEAIAEDIERLMPDDPDRQERTKHLRLRTMPSPAAMEAYRSRVRRARGRLQAARNRFVCANLRLVVRVAQRYGRQHMPLADRIQEGNLGLMKAVDRFDPERGIRFSTYAAWWIRHNITRALVNRGRNVRIPAHLHNVFSKMSKAERSLKGELGREPTVEEIAARIEIPPEKVRMARDAMELRSVGLETSETGEDSRPAIETIESTVERHTDDAIDDRRNVTIMSNAFSELDPMEQDILCHRFGLKGAPRLTLQKLGERYSLSRERIRQVQNRALAKLREVIESSPLPATAFA